MPRKASQAGADRREAATGGRVSFAGPEGGGRYPGDRRH